MAAPAHRPPASCPVCGERLLLTRLGCSECGTELAGAFQPCEFCSVGADDRTLLRVFLASRGNMKELERHLGVSYPTARARFDALLGRLGIEPAKQPDPRLELLDALARGEIDVDEATRRLA
jgi:hypothetical protein